MEQSRKNLKLSAIAVLVWAGATLIGLISELLYGEINSAAIPEGAPDNILLITKIFLVSISLLLLLPQVYIGIKGLRIAKNPNFSKGHIVWAVILLVFAVLGIIDPIVNLAKSGDTFNDIRSLSGVVLEIAIYFEYIKYAREVRKNF